MFTKLITFTLISLLAVTQAAAQDIEIQPKLVTGDKFRLDVARVRRDSSRPQMNATGRTVVDVQVISAGPTGWVLDWVPGDTAFDNPQVSQDPLVAAASQASKGMRFRIALGAGGEFSGLLNEAEVRPKLQGMVTAIVSELAERLPANQRKNLEDVMGQLLTPAALISSATRDVEIYFALNRAVLAAGESIELNIDQPSPMGGSAIPTIFRVRMDSVTATSAMLTTATTYDKDALLRLTMELAQRAGASVRPQDAAKVPPMQMADDGKYEFDRVLGLMRKVAINRRVTMAAQERVEGWTITLVDSPKR